MLNITVDISNTTLVGEFTLSANLLDNNTPIFSFQAYSRFAIVPVYSNQSFNLRVDTPIDVIDTTLIAVDAKYAYGTVDESQLKSFIDTSIDNYLKSNPIYLFKQNIDFSKFFSSSKLIVIPDQGYVIAGEAAFPYQSSAPQNFEDFLYRELKLKLNN